MTIKLKKGIKAINWIMYREYCKRNNLKQHNFNSLESFINRR